MTPPEHIFRARARASAILRLWAEVLFEPKIMPAPEAWNQEALPEKKSKKRIHSQVKMNVWKHLILKCAYWFELKSRYSNNDLWSDSSFRIWLEILRYVFQAISQVFMRYILLWYSIVVISIPVIVVYVLYTHTRKYKTWMVMEVSSVSPSYQLISRCIISFCLSCFVSTRD